MSKISEYILLETMYRDGDNYKSHDTVVYSNNQNISDDIILERIQPFIDGGIDFIPEYYNIPNISPVENEFMEHEGSDHPFQTIEAISFSEDLDKENDVHEDIAELLNRIDNPDIIEFAREETKTYAIDSLKKQLQYLGKLATTKIIITMENGIITAVGGNTGEVKVIILDYDKNADDPIEISEQLEPDYIFKDGEAWKNWDGETISAEDKRVKRHLKKIKF